MVYFINHIQLPWQVRPLRFAMIATMAALTSSIALSWLLQMALEQLCATRLGIMWILGVAFWFITGPYGFRMASKQRNTSKVVLLGIALVGANQSLIYLAVPNFLYLSFGCEDTYNNWLTNSLSNNLVTNAICFASFVVAARWPSANQVDKREPVFSPNERLSTVEVKYGNVVRSVAIQTIFLVEVEHNCISLFTNGGKHVLYRSLSSFLEEMPDCFVRVHRSRAVNRNHVEKITHLPSGDAIIALQNGVEVRMSRTYKRYLS